MRKTRTNGTDIGGADRNYYGIITVKTGTFTVVITVITASSQNGFGKGK
jgi:hypothetical protein